ncbi:unnamed protein product [Lasius platythorax]|uniref:Uncharacterized protein n=1 Tax=Lasius platythorax TaxID=488582 RepID=A0AAV2NUU0_9HYME
MAVHALGKDILNYVVSLANRGILSAYPLSLSAPPQFLCAAKLMPLGTVSNLRREYPTILALKSLMRTPESTAVVRSILSGAFCNSRSRVQRGVLK